MYFAIKAVLIVLLMLCSYSQDPSDEEYEQVFMGTGEQHGSIVSLLKFATWLLVYDPQGIRKLKFKDELC